MGDSLRWNTSWYDLLKGDESDSQAMALGFINGVLGLTISTIFIILELLFGLIFIILASLSFIGIFFVSKEKYGPGAIILIISGIAFFPIGIIGIIAGKISWKNTDRYRMKHRPPVIGRMTKRGIQP
jgi:hypothetical protein